MAKVPAFPNWLPTRRRLVIVRAATSEVPQDYNDTSMRVILSKIARIQHEPPSLDSVKPRLTTRRTSLLWPNADEQFGPSIPLRQSYHNVRDEPFFSLFQVL